jgi:hypothetical protein
LFQTPKIETVDIDTPEDWEIAARAAAALA